MEGDAMVVTLIEITFYGCETGHFIEGQKETN